MPVPGRRRDIRTTETPDGPALPLEHVQKAGWALDRGEARGVFAAYRAKADETIAILDALGAGFRVPLSGASEQLRAAVRHLDPASGGEYLSWETYKLAADRVLAMSFPDLPAFLRSRTRDPQRDHEILKTLMLEQAMAL